MSDIRKILITGAGGYLGSRLSLYLAEKGHKIFAVCYPNLPDNEEWASKINKLVVGDVADSGFINELKNEKIDTIIHLVSLDHIDSEKNNEFVFNINVKPLLLLLEAFKGTSTDKVIYFSTMQVYGKNLKNIIEESQIPSPVNKYGLTHYLCENIMNYYNSPQMNCLNIRLSNSYGHPVFSNSNCWKLVINDLCQMAYLKKEIRLLSDGSPLRDFIHFKDVCQAVEFLIFKINSDYQENTFNVSSGETFTILELAVFVQSVYFEIFKHKVPIFLVNGEKFNENRVLPIPNKYIIDNSKLRKLGFESKTDLNTGIKELFDYLDLYYGKSAL